MIVSSSLETQVIRWRYLIFCAVAGLIAFSTSISFVISDSYLLFHEGEYVGLLWHLRAFRDGLIEFPLIIHGAMDYLPAMLASVIYGDDHIIVGTRALNTFITWACWVLFLDLCYLVTCRTTQRLVWIGAAVLALFAITPKLGSHALAVQQSFLGVRDCFLILTTWCLAQHTYSPGGSIRSNLVLVLGGLSAATAFFWSYDRGIICLVAVGVYVAGLAAQRNYRNVVVIVSAIAAAGLLLDQSRLLGSVADNLRNIEYWLRSAKEISGTSIFADKITFIIIALVFVFCVATPLIAFVQKFYTDRAGRLLVLTIIVVQVALLKTVMTRPGMPRLSWAIWPSLLILIYLASRANLRRFGINSAPELAPEQRRPFLYTACAALFLLMAFVMSPLMLSYGSFAKNILMPKYDREVASVEVGSLSDTLTGFHSQCVFGWINEGVVALLLKQRLCTRFPYSAYVSKAEEGEYLSQLQSDSPEAIVVGVRGVNMVDIGSGSMTSRFPAVDRYIEDNYPEKTEVGRYTVATKAPRAVGH